MRGDFAASSSCSSSASARFWYAYSRLEEGPGRRHAEKNDKVFSGRGRQDRRDRDQVGIRRADDARARRHGLGRSCSPRPAPTDQATVSGITSNLASLEIQRVIDENPADSRSSASRTPRVEVAFKAGGQQHRLQIGQKTPPGTDVYARLADSKRVFLIPSFLDSTFNREHLRPSRQVGAEGRSREGRLARRHDGRTSTMRFEKTERRVADRAAARRPRRFSAVDGLVQPRQRAADEVAACLTPPISQKYGLDKPAATVRIGIGFVAGDAGARRRRGRRQRLREGPRHVPQSSRSNRRCSTI